MEKTVIRKGMLVRRKMPSSLIPIGPWLIVRSSNNGITKAERVDSDYMMRKTDDIRELKRDMLYIPEHAALNISAKAIDDIILGKQWAVTHPLTPKWERIAKQSPEIITFFTTNGNKVVVSVDEIKQGCYIREKYIKIYIRSIITKCVWS